MVSKPAPASGYLTGSTHTAEPEQAKCGHDKRKALWHSGAAAVCYCSSLSAAKLHGSQAELGQPPDKLMDTLVDKVRHPASPKQALVEARGPSCSESFVCNHRWQLAGPSAEMGANVLRRAPGLPIPARFGVQVCLDMCTGTACGVVCFRRARVCFAFGGVRWGIPGLGGRYECDRKQGGLATWRSAKSGI